MDDADGGKLDDGEEAGSMVVVSIAGTPELRRPDEEALDEIVLSDDRFLSAQLRLAVRAAWNIGNGALITDAGAQAVGVIALASDDDGARPGPVA